MPTQLPFSPIPKILADTQLPLYQEEKCNGKEFKMERGSGLSHFQILLKHKTILTYYLGNNQANDGP